MTNHVCVLEGKQNWISVSQQLIKMCSIVNVCAYLCKSWARNDGRIMWDISWWQPRAYCYHGPEGDATVAMVFTHLLLSGAEGTHMRSGAEGGTHMRRICLEAFPIVFPCRGAPGAYLLFPWGASLARSVQLYPSNWKLIAACSLRFNGKNIFRKRMPFNCWTLMVKSDEEESATSLIVWVQLQLQYHQSSYLSQTAFSRHHAKTSPKSTKIFV